MREYEPIGQWSSMGVHQRPYYGDPGSRVPSRFERNKMATAHHGLLTIRREAQKVPPRVASGRSPSRSRLLSRSSVRSLDEQSTANGLTVLCTFHQLIGLSYCSLNDSLIVQLITLLISILFTVAYVALHVPCLFSCTYEVRTDQGVTLELLYFTIVVVEVYEVVAVHLEFILKGERLRNFFNKCDLIGRLTKVQDGEHFGQSITIFCFVLVAFNVLYGLAEASILYFTLDHRLLPNSNMTSANFTIIGSQPLVAVHESVLYYVTLVLRTFGSVHSKASQTLIIALCYYTTLIARQLNERLKFFLRSYEIMDKPNIETERLLYLELRSAILELQELLDVFAFKAIFIDIFVTFTGLFILIDATVNRHEFTNDDIHEILNISISLIAVLFICLSSNKLYHEQVILQHNTSFLSLDYLDAKNFKTFTVMITMMGDKIPLTAGSAITLDMKFFFQLAIMVIIFVFVLIHKEILA
ncbi:hypothetical protein HDE_10463 [Halotydeus destructor]|nr:hypothetical protein HDE_10463 [Halotydeus destructor]